MMTDVLDISCGREDDSINLYMHDLQKTASCLATAIDSFSGVSSHEVVGVRASFPWLPTASSPPTKTYIGGVTIDEDLDPSLWMAFVNPAVGQDSIVDSPSSDSAHGAGTCCDEKVGCGWTLDGVRRGRRTKQSTVCAWSSAEGRYLRRTDCGREGTERRGRSTDR